MTTADLTTTIQATVDRHVAAQADLANAIVSLLANVPVGDRMDAPKAGYDLLIETVRTPQGGIACGYNPARAILVKGTVIAPASDRYYEGGYSPNPKRIESASHAVLVEVASQLGETIARWQSRKDAESEAAEQAKASLPAAA